MFLHVNDRLYQINISISSMLSLLQITSRVHYVGAIFCLAKKNLNNIHYNPFVSKLKFNRRNNIQNLNFIFLITKIILASIQLLLFICNISHARHFNSQDTCMTVSQCYLGQKYTKKKVVEKSSKYISDFCTLLAIIAETD